MSPAYLRFLLLLLFAFGWNGCDPGVPQETVDQLRNTDKTFRFLSEVVLRPEYNSSEPIVVKWTSAAKLSVFGASPKEQAMVAETVGELNEILEGSRFSIRMLEPESPKANLKVFFAASAQFEDLARQHQFKYVPGNRGYFTYWTHGMGGIVKAVVLIDSKTGTGFKKHLVREELTQALGLANDSSLFRNSIFYASGSFGGNARKFSDLDKKLIHFFYAHLSPGYAEQKLAQAYLKHWPSGD